MTKNKKKIFDVIIIGAGAAGLFAAKTAGELNKKVLILEHREKIAEKIRISGGGKCNFTNLNISADNFISQNPHFCKSALKQFTQYDFIDFVEQHKIDYFEKTKGQLFCKNSAKDIIEALKIECNKPNIQIKLGVKITEINKSENIFYVTSNIGKWKTKALIIATGGMSIPKIGATSFGYEIAKQFGLKIIPTSPALVAFVFENDMLAYCKSLAGISLIAEVKYQKQKFKDGIVFTHKGLSGPAILQISSYWEKGGTININLCPNYDIYQILLDAKQNQPSKKINNILSKYLPNKLIYNISNNSKYIVEISNTELRQLANRINNWQITPTNTEGYKKAEVTKGGIDTAELSSKNMECKNIKNLYFIGELLDVTGHLGGYNLQWAWSSAFAAASHL